MAKRIHYTFDVSVLEGEGLLLDRQSVADALSSHFIFTRTDTFKVRTVKKPDAATVRKIRNMDA